LLARLTEIQKRNALSSVSQASKNILQFRKSFNKKTARPGAAGPAGELLERLEAALVKK
jgi:hypothetical protein